jgi:hypothetical protein
MSSVLGTKAAALADNNFIRLNACLQELQARLGAAETKARELQTELDSRVKVAHLTNAILAFDADKCPEGWTPYRSTMGRVIIGGTAKEELPGSQAGTTMVIGFPKPPIVASRGDIGGMRVGNALLKFQGGQIQPNEGAAFLTVTPPIQDWRSDQGDLFGHVVTHYMVPPYVALYYCRKI